MTYAYVIVTTLLTFKYITIVYLAMCCQNTCGGRLLYIKIFLASLYIIKCLLAFDEHVHLPCNSQVSYATTR